MLQSYKNNRKTPIVPYRKPCLTGKEKIHYIIDGETSCFDRVNLCEWMSTHRDANFRHLCRDDFIAWSVEGGAYVFSENVVKDTAREAIQCARNLHAGLLAGPHVFRYNKKQVCASADDGGLYPLENEVSDMRQSSHPCPCKRMQCPRHGDCAACRDHHDQFKRKMRPACERPEAKRRNKPCRD